jgi:hypothetical protein
MLAVELFAMPCTLAYTNDNFALFVSHNATLVQHTTGLTLTASGGGGGGGLTPIYTIQGSGTASPLAATIVRTRGVVTLALPTYDVPGYVPVLMLHQCGHTACTSCSRLRAVLHYQNLTPIATASRGAVLQ